jgi:hypothetical protein
MAYANGKLSRPWFVDGDHETVVGVDRAKKPWIRQGLPAPT